MDVFRGTTNIRRTTGRPGIPDMGERAYAYAKACGIIGKSFIGKGIRRLDNLQSLSELDRTVFPAASRDLPEKELLPDLEKRITGRAVNSIISIIDCFPNPPLFLVLLIRGYEYSDLLAALMASLEGEKNAPAHTDIGRFQTVRFDKWPDVRAMIESTEFEFLLDKRGVLNRELGDISLQTIMDRHYYSALWNAVFSLPKNDREIAVKILAEEISIKNSTWALRLRTYYRMPVEEVKLHLVYVPVKKKLNHKQKSGAPNMAAPNLAAPNLARVYLTAAGRAPANLADDAVRCLEYPLDSFEPWSSWRWKSLLNPDEGGAGPWLANPRHFQNAASRYLFHLAKHNFHLNPFSLDTIFCFVKMKQFEEDVLTSNAEGLGMGISGRDIASLLGVEA